MTHAETLALIAAAQAGDTSAEERLLQAHEGLIYRLAARYRRGPGSLPIADLMQEGRMGMLMAIRRFDLSRATQFTAYAYQWIHGRLRQAVRRQPRWQQEGDPVVAEVMPLEGIPDHRAAADNDEPTKPDLSRWLAVLTDEQRQVIILRFGLDGQGERRHRNIARQLGWSRWRVNEVLREAFQRLREYPRAMAVLQCRPEGD